MTSPSPSCLRLTSDLKPNYPPCQTGRQVTLSSRPRAGRMPTSLVLLAEWPTASKPRPPDLTLLSVLNSRGRSGVAMRAVPLWVAGDLGRNASVFGEPGQPGVLVASACAPPLVASRPRTTRGPGSPKMLSPVRRVQDLLISLRKTIINRSALPQTRGFTLLRYAHRLAKMASGPRIRTVFHRLVHELRTNRESLNLTRTA